jgi:hypothetical protein
MSDQVNVGFDESPRDQAVLLLAAAEDLGLDQSVVKTYEGGFTVPKEVHEKAFPPKHSGRKKKSESEEG